MYDCQEIFGFSGILCSECGCDADFSYIAVAIEISSEIAVREIVLFVICTVCGRYSRSIRKNNSLCAGQWSQNSRICAVVEIIAAWSKTQPYSPISSVGTVGTKS